MSTLAVVIGDMDLVRPLGLAGIRCVAAGPTGPETAWSRHSVDAISLPDLWDDPEAVTRRLIDYARTLDHRPVLVYQKDPAVLLISRDREELGAWYRFVVPDHEVVEDLVDKERFQARAEALGVPVPLGRSGVAGRDPLPDAGMTYPLVVKPVLRSRPQQTWQAVAGGSKALTVSDSAELRGLWQRPELRDVRTMVQEYVPGDATTIVSYHAYVDADGTVVGQFTGRKIRTNPPEVGISTAVEITRDDRAAETGRAALRAFGFTGVAKVDMKRTPGGDHVVVEINPRFNLWHHPGAVAGVNLPAAVYRHLTEGRTQPLPPATAGVRWVQVWGDWSSSGQAGVPRTTWMKSVIDAQARRAFHLDDPGATAGALAWAVLKRRGSQAHHDAGTSESAATPRP
ncbi:MAG TPA: hypothetical protein VFZ70_15355 [Euzebyales bacterium]